MAETHVVEQGETVASIARRHGIADWRWLWRHPDNAPLRALREDPNVLAPGDEVAIPEREPVLHAVGADGRYRFVARRPSVGLRLYLRDEGPHADPLADLRWRLSVAGETLEGRTTEDGLLEARLPDEHVRDAHGSPATLEVWMSDDEDPFEWDLRIGALDPAETTSGLWARLENLAFDCGEDGEPGGDETDRALAAFRAAHGIADDDPSADERARRALVSAHRS